MISSARSRVRAPSASAVSASPSRWSAPVSSAPTRERDARRRRAPAGTCTSPYAAPPTTAPIPAPTSGKSAAPRATSRVERDERRPGSASGTRRAAAPRATQRPASVTPASSKLAMSFSRASELAMIGSASAAPLPSPSRIPKSTQRLQPERVEDERVPGLGRAVRGDHRVDGRWSTRAATSAAAPVMKPSSTTGTRSA